MCNSILVFEQSFNFGIFSTNYIIIVKKYFKRPNKIHIFRIDEIYKMTRTIKCRDLRNFLEFKKIEVINFFFSFQRIFCLLKNLTKIFTPFCRSRRADSKYIYFVGSLKVFFYYNYIIVGKNSKIVQIPRLSGTYINVM